MDQIQTVVVTVATWMAPKRVMKMKVETDESQLQVR
jgi:hypothetical protein